MSAINVKDKKILHKLAAEWREISESKEMRELKKLWYEHNAMRGVRPMVTVESSSFCEELIPDMMECEGDNARKLERRLREGLLNAVYFKDDTVVDSFFPVTLYGWIKPFDIDVKIDRQDSSLGHHFVEQIHDLEEDFGKLKKSTFYSGRKDAQAFCDLANDSFGDILPAKLVGKCLGSCLTQDIVHIMSMETMFISMCDYPELFHKMMKMLSDDYIEFYRFCEKEKLLLPTTDSERVGQGTYAFTKELKQKDNPVSKEIWGYMDSQETVNVSPQMFGEFIFPYYSKVAEQFGLTSYGCCEPVHPFWSEYLSKLPGLRKVSISAWCDQSFMGEKLKGGKVMFHRKPAATFLGVGEELDKEAFKKDIQATMQAAKGCKVEFTQRDVYTVNRSLKKVEEYVSIVRENGVY